MAHVEECLWKDPAFVLEAAALHACAIQHADDALRLNRPFLLSAFERNPECICYVHPQLQSDRSFFIEPWQCLPEIVSLCFFTYVLSPRPNVDIEVI